MPCGDRFAVKFKEYCGFEWPGWLRVTIWTAAALFLTGLAIHDFVYIAYEYKYNNDATETDVVIKNESLIRPELALCIPYYSSALENVANWVRSHLGEILDGDSPPTDDCIECEALKNNSWDIWTNLTFRRELILQPASVMATLFVKKLIQEDDLQTLLLNKPETSSEYVYWNQPIVDAVWFYIACRYARDLWFAGDGAAWIANCRYIDMAKIGPIPNEQLDQLFNYSVGAVDVYMRTQIYVPSDGTFLMPPLQTRNGFIPFTKKFCFSILPNSSSEEYPFYTYTAVDRPNLPPWKRSNRKGMFEIHDLTSMGSLLNADQALFKTNETEMKEIGWHVVKLAYSIETMVTEKRTDRPCSEDRVPSSCLAKRQVQHAIDTCQCVPFAFRSLTEDSGDLPYCNNTFYDLCTDKIGGWEQGGEMLNMKRRECEAKCEYIFYKWKITHRAVGPDFVFHLELSHEDRPFIRFTLTTKTTIEQFIAQVGGVFGIYLGFSGLTAFALILFLIDTVKRFSVKTNQQAADSNSNDAMTGLRMFWMARILQVAQHEPVADGSNQEVQDLREEMEVKLDALKEELMQNINGTNQSLKENFEEMRELKVAVQEMLEAWKARDYKPDKGASFHSVTDSM